KMRAGAYDVVIIGAGIVGAACAWACASEGLRVAVIEADIIGGGATGAGMGHLVVMDDSEAQFALTRYSRSLWQQLVTELPGDVEYESCGTIWVAADEEEMEAVRQKKDFYETRGVPAEMLDAKALRMAEPNLREGLAGGLRVPGDAVIYAPCAARFFIERAQSRGAELYLPRVVTEVTAEGVRLNDGTVIAAHRVVNAAGTWSPMLTPGIEVKKRKGHLVITERYAGFVKHQLVELGYLKSAHSMTTESVAFNVQPRRTGQMLIGSSRQFDVEGKGVDANILRRMLGRAAEFLPGVNRLSAIRSWTGFRAATPDKLPLIGPWLGRENVFLATGHEGLGITTSLGTAKLLVDQLLRRTSEIPIAPYLPSRVPEGVHA
ncbi:MAG TPA: FAD-dependent oxidoreductase, partial [Candidatus Acidoferrales bacterium]|nr:FAD-dependent oxidoreductase [Candidatus Acidoferrales bacterium]